MDISQMEAILAALNDADIGGVNVDISQENMEAMLAMLKVDLGIVTAAYDERLTQYLTAAAGSIKREGVTLDFVDLEDKQLVVMYAAWTWRRRDTMEGMPRMLRWQLNNRIFAGKMADG